MEFKNIVPWGRTLSEYKDMFLLTEKDLKQTIFGCGDVVYIFLPKKSWQNILMRLQWK